jgi:hypothetical protein
MLSLIGYTQWGVGEQLGHQRNGLHFRLGNIDPFPARQKQRNVLWITHYDLGLIAADSRTIPKRLPSGNAPQAELHAVSQLHKQRKQDLIVKVHGALQ